MNELVDEHTPHLLKAANAFLGAISAQASSDATKSIIIMVACVAISALCAIFFMWMTGALVLKPLIRIKDTVEKFANGDLTSRADVKIHFLGRDMEDEIYSLGQSVDEMARKMSDVIGRISASSAHLASASEELSASATQIATGAEEQDARASHVATASQQMSATVIEVAKNASGASEAAQNANQAAIEGGGIVEKTIESMNGISETARESSEVIGALGSRSQEIGKIIRVIEDIADQTNLLALNAAIEAARAGEQGRGFAVVADEVRKLAERTGKATKEIGEMITAIQEETEKAISTMDKEIQVVEEGVSLAEQAGASLTEISSQVDHVTGVIQQIATASEEQSTAADQISGDIESVASITKDTATGSQQIVVASQEMAKLASNLQGMVSMFKIFEDSAGSLKVDNAVMIKEFGNVEGEGKKEEDVLSLVSH
jgi:methyl-accepting chemotaxis protein